MLNFSSKLIRAMPKKPIAKSPLMMAASRPFSLL